MNTSAMSEIRDVAGVPKTSSPIPIWRQEAEASRIQHLDRVVTLQAENVRERVPIRFLSRPKEP
jgi:hypothetical protein